MNSLGWKPALLQQLLAVPATRTTTGKTLSRIATLGSVRRETGAAAVKKETYRKKGSKPPIPDGHGERIWIYNHIMDGHIVWSFTPDMRSNKAMRQFPYTGKKNVPAKLRKDYWRPMAIVEFAPGAGKVGRSVYQKCRELKKRHELEWKDESLLNMKRLERGKELNDQKGNTVADLAYVLAGNGKGNKMPVTRVVEEEVRAKKLITEEEGEANAEVVAKPARFVKKAIEEVDEEGKKKLHGVTVYWANEQDRYYAESWSENVSHVVGLPERVYQKREKKVKGEKEEKEEKSKVEEVAEKVTEKAEAVAEKLAADRVAA